jgi:hypothetical protein
VCLTTNLNNLYEIVRYLEKDGYPKDKYTYAGQIEITKAREDIDVSHCSLPWGKLCPVGSGGASRKMLGGPS